MIFGKTKDQKWARRQARLKKLFVGQRRFALFPVQLVDERWIWLRSYTKYDQGIINPRTKEITMYSVRHVFRYLSDSIDDTCHFDHEQLELAKVIQQELLDNVGRKNRIK